MCDKHLTYWAAFSLFCFLYYFNGLKDGHISDNIFVNFWLLHQRCGLDSLLVSEQFHNCWQVNCFIMSSWVKLPLKTSYSSHYITSNFSILSLWNRDSTYSAAPETCFPDFECISESKPRLSTKLPKRSALVFSRKAYRISSIAFLVIEFLGVPVKYSGLVRIVAVTSFNQMTP